MIKVNKYTIQKCDYAKVNKYTIHKCDRSYTVGASAHNIPPFLKIEDASIY